MEFIEFTRGEIADLATKISEVAHELTEQERQLLLAVFAAAADRAQAVDVTRNLAELPAARFNPPEVTGEDLKQQLLGAYTPGQTFAEVTSGLQHSIKPGVHPPHDDGGGN